MADLLSVRNLSKRFVENVILDSVCFELECKRIYVLVGANGSGKSTLFNVLTGFLPFDGGDLQFQKQSISKLHPYQINRLGIGRTFQDLRIVTKLTVRE